MSSYMSRLFPRSNTSYLLTSGKALQAQVLRLNKDTLLVDTGMRTPKICKEEELIGVPKDPKITRFASKVGFLDLVAGESSIQKHILERFFIDIVTGDPRIKEGATSRLNDLMGPAADAVVGEPVILLPRRFRQNLARMELKKLQQRNGTVNGFVVGRVKGGFTVAVAGFIGFLPARRYPRHMPGKFAVNDLRFKF